MSYLRFQEIHIGSVIIFHRGNIPPVIPYFVAVNPPYIFISDQDIPDKIISVLFRAFFHHFDQLAAAQNINPAGDDI